MSFTLLYWHWLVIGMILIIAELFIPSFTIFWFGLGALLVGLLLLVLPGLGLTWQLLLWALASVVFTILWFKIIKPKMPDRTTAGMAREAVLGETGQVIKVPAEDRRGMVRFSTPLLGADEWQFMCDQKVDVGDRVAVKEVSGNTLVVEKK